ncbi:MAG: hypothetical protein FWD44_08980, partial [Oscillospiraceae bacterium]|nr:hypothetical protein [Oscillospiraceae bacterium]
MFNVAKKKDDAIALIFFGCIGLFITTLLLIFAFNDSSRGEDKSTGDLEAPPPIVSYPNVSDDFPAPPTPPPTPPPERPVHSSDETSDMLSNIYKIALVIIGLLSVFLIFLGIQVMRRVKRLRRYFALVTTQNMYSLDELAANTYKPVEFVRKDLQEMIDKGYIYYASINVTTNKLIISKP